MRRELVNQAVAGGMFFIAFSGPIVFWQGLSIIMANTFLSCHMNWLLHYFVA